MSDENKTDPNEYYRLAGGTEPQQVTSKAEPDLTVIQENLLEQSIHHRSSREPASSAKGHSIISDLASQRARKPLICIEIDTGDD